MKRGAGITALHNERGRRRRRDEMRGDGIKCKCGYIEPFGLYVLAHVGLSLRFTCPKCGKERSFVYQGPAVRKKNKERP
jgi:hypothetical protein